MLCRSSNLGSKFVKLSAVQNSPTLTFSIRCGVFNLEEDSSGNRRKESQTKEEMISQCLRRIALALDIDPSGLKAEWKTLRPVALAQKCGSQMGNREAWKEAYKHSQKNNHTRSKYPAKYLQKALQAYVCWSPSSSFGYYIFNTVMFDFFFPTLNFLKINLCMNFYHTARKVWSGAALFESRSMFSRRTFWSQGCGH